MESLSPSPPSFLPSDQCYLSPSLRLLINREKYAPPVLLSSYFISLTPFPLLIPLIFGDELASASHPLPAEILIVRLPWDQS